MKRFMLAVVGLLDTGSTVNILPYPLGLQLGLVWEQQTTETAGAWCDRLRPSGIVSTGRARVRLDAIARRANDPGTSKLFHGIRCMLFPVSSSI